MNLPTADEYIEAALTGFRAMPRETTVFGPAGRATVRSNGEALIYGPNGAVIGRVTEDPLGGTQIEQDERLHAVVRPQTRQMLLRRRPGLPPEVVSIS
jgi:hypothetical protein